MAFMDKFGEVIIDFGDKAGEFAKVVGSKAESAIETGKLNAKLLSEKKALEKELKQIGAYYYDMYQKGATVNEGVMDYCKSADYHSKIIKAIQEEIEKTNK